MTTAGDNSEICHQCGAKLKPEAQHCELCGSTRKTTDSVHASRSLPSGVIKTTRPSASAGECRACGRRNRLDAIFCDQCATPVSVQTADKTPLSATVSIRTKQEQTSGGSDAGVAQPKSRVGLQIALGITTVAILYGISFISAERASSSSDTSENSNTSAIITDAYLPEDSGMESQSRAISDAAAGADDPARKTALLQQLVELYAGSGRFDLAGREQERIAQEHQNAEEWTTAGNLHFDWMEQQSGPERIAAARRAVAAYLNSLEIEPSNLDVRTDLGVAYLNDPANPMSAVKETNAVLEADSNHVQANFNKGIMLLQVGRQENAVRLFQKVISLTEDGSPANDRARQILQQIDGTAG